MYVENELHHKSNHGCNIQDSVTKVFTLKLHAENACVNSMWQLALRDEIFQLSENLLRTCPPIQIKN